MNTQYSPGPWAVKHHEETNSYTVHVAKKSWQSWSIAGLNDCTQDEANARLIAAAPELLEALEGVMYWDNGKPEWEIARAAIAKATGMTP